MYQKKSINFEGSKMKNKKYFFAKKKNRDMMNNFCMSPKGSISVWDVKTKI